MAVQASPSSADPFLGQTLSGKFRVQNVATQSAEVIGYVGTDGTSGNVIRIQRPTAVSHAPDAPARLRTVAELIKRLKSVAGAVSPLASGLHGGVPYLVLPVVPGGTLADRLQQLNATGGGIASLRSVNVWLKRVAEILDQMHEQGLVHGQLTPHSIGFGTGQRPLIDGVPIAELVRAVGSDSARVSDAVSQPYAAPETTSSARPEPASDQFSLAAIVAECLGANSFTATINSRASSIQSPAKLPRAVAKALAGQPSERFVNCVTFAEALVAEAENSRQFPMPSSAASPPEPPLGLEPPYVAETKGKQTAARLNPPVEVPLELEEIESDADRRAGRRSRDPVEDDLDITFTKAGESLLTPKTTYDRVRGLAATRTAWRRMLYGYRELIGTRLWIARLTLGLLGLVLALWIVQAGWWGVRYVTGAAQSVAKSVVEKVQPDVASLQESGDKFVKSMQDLWDNVRPPEDTVATVGAPRRVASVERIKGTPWPERIQDQLRSDQIKDPAPLVTEILRHKGRFYAQENLGAFHIDDPRHVDVPEWIGGYGIERKPGVPPAVLLHGTVVRHGEDGTACVAEYRKNAMLQFWRVTGRNGRRVVASTMIDASEGEPIADGAAFVLDEFENSCVAFVLEQGKPIGGQWCERFVQQDDSTKGGYFPPEDIVALDKLAADDERFEDYRFRLENMLEAIPDFDKQAAVSLKAFRKTAKR